MKNSGAWTDRIISIFAALIALAAAIMTDRAGMPQKWHAAIFGALVPFAVVVSMKRTSWQRLTFWTTLAACFAMNSLLIWMFFVIVLRNVMTFGWIWWVPVAFIETFVILHFQNLIERKLRAR